MPTIYIAYSGEDTQLAQTLKSQLTEAGFDTWMHPADQWDAGIDEAIRRVAAMVVLLSPEAAESSLVTFEWAYASGCNIPLIVLRLGPARRHPKLESFTSLDFPLVGTPPWKELIHQLQGIVDLSTTSVIRKTQPLKQTQILQPSEQTDVNATKPGRDILDLVNSLRDPDPSQRREAVKGLAQERERSSLTHLLTALKDKDPDVRHSAAAALGRLRYTDAVPPLIKTLRDDLSSKVRAAAAEALWSIGDGRAVGGLRDALRDSSAPVREYAAYALGGLEDHPSTKKLRDLLTDRHESVRAAATTALGQIGAPESVDHLCLRLLRDESAVVRGAAAHALGKVGEPMTVPILEQALYKDEESVQTAVAQALTQIGSEDAHRILEDWQGTK